MRQSVCLPLDRGLPSHSRNPRSNSTGRSAETARVQPFQQRSGQNRRFWHGLVLPARHGDRGAHHRRGAGVRTPPRDQPAAAAAVFWSEHETLVARVMHPRQQVDPASRSSGMGGARWSENQKETGGRKGGSRGRQEGGREATGRQGKTGVCSVAIDERIMSLRGMTNGGGLEQIVRCPVRVSSLT